MGRDRGSRRTPDSRADTRADPADEAGTSPVEFVDDGTGGTVVMIDGHPQSYVQLGDPRLLVFEYVQFLAAVVDVLPEGPVAATHVGGAGLTLPRYVAHTRPGSPQIVLEPAQDVTSAVRQTLPLPRGHRIRVRPVDGRSGLRQLADGSAELVAVDAYAAGRVPAELTSTEWFTDVARVLGAGGLLAMNTADEPSRRHLARLHATIATVLPHTAAIATSEVRKGRRFGNTVLVASAQPLPLTALARRVAMTAFSATLLHGPSLARTLGSAQPFTDEDAEASPEPPRVEGWRVR
ncbi:spermidine synthase [Phycicoccus sp. Root101]|uniref:spermidine synthase n=1 Tax=Phycicoccus sp. Root101 TaxID=1736421 RepID=UPI000B0AC539|nr:fused MFS/spermidine synthase [Phycicoccus sp. Root101]